MGKNKKKTQNSGKVKAAPVEREVEVKEEQRADEERIESGPIGGEGRSEGVEEVQATAEDAPVGNAEVAEKVAAITETEPIAISTKDEPVPLHDDSPSSATHDTKTEEQIPHSSALVIPDTQAESAEEPAAEIVVTESSGKLYAPPTQA
jgi:hypothetical protein